MQVKFTARHFEPRQSLRDTAIALAENFSKFNDDIISTEVILSLDNEIVKIAEFIVHVGGQTLVIKESSDDFQKSVHEAADKMERQLKRLKDKELSDIRATNN